MAKRWGAARWASVTKKRTPQRPPQPLWHVGRQTPHNPDSTNPEEHVVLVRAPWGNQARVPRAPQRKQDKRTRKQRSTMGIVVCSL